MCQAPCLTLWFNTQIAPGLAEKEGRCGSCWWRGGGQAARSKASALLLTGWVFSQGSLSLLPLASLTCRSEITEIAHLYRVLPLYEHSPWLINALLSTALWGSIFISIPILQKRHRKGTCLSSQPPVGGLRISGSGTCVLFYPSSSTYGRGLTGFTYFISIMPATYLSKDFFH